MWFVVCTKKLKFIKLVWCKIDIHVFMLDHLIMLHMILPGCPLFLDILVLFSPLCKIPCVSGALDKYFWSSSAKLTSEFSASVWTDICVSNRLLTGICALALRWKMKLFSIAFRPSTNSLLCNGTLIPRSIIILMDCDNIYNKYNSVAHM